MADSILDEFSQRSLERELTLRPVGLRGRRGRRTAMLLAETAWTGNGGRWQHQFSNFRRGNDLDRLLGRYRGAGVPTVLWNKEDPVHFERFLDAARGFDHVLTTDADCVDRYRAELGHDRVGVMMFAAQPAVHNPIGRRVDPESICFAGAWRGDVHPQRIQQLTMLLDAARAAGQLRIYARRPSHGRDDFPPPYRSAVAGELPYDRMVEEYRRHACFLNVNTVVGSPTMMSRRVFEILACRTPVVSAPSPAIDALFDGIVPTPGNLADASTVLRELVESPGRRDRLGQLGYRAVMTSHTYQHRVADLCERLGIDGFPPPTSPTVDVVLELPERTDVEAAVAAVAPLRSSIGRIVAIHRATDHDTTEERDGLVLVSVPPHRSSAEVLGAIPGHSEFVALLDRRATYGSAMLSDALLATRFVDADAYGKASSHLADGDRIRQWGSGSEFTPGAELLEGTVIIRRTALEHPTDRRPTPGRPTSLTAVALEAARTTFAVDRFNHVAPDGTDGAAGSPVSTADVFV